MPAAPSSGEPLIPVHPSSLATKPGLFSDKYPVLHDVLATGLQHRIVRAEFLGVENYRGDFFTGGLGGELLSAAAGGVLSAEAFEGEE